MANGLIDFPEDEREEVGPLDADGGEEDVETEDEQSDVDMLREALTAEDYEESDDEEDSEESQEDSQPEDPEQQDFKNEENAQNAERRRQNEQRLMERLRQQSPEYHLAQMLGQQFGKTPEQLLADLQQAQIAQQAQQAGVPVEYAQRLFAAEQAAMTLQQQFEQYQNQQGFMAWQSRVDAETQAVKQQYPGLTDADIDAAKEYALVTLKNTDIPLEQALFAVHGKKMLSMVQEASRNEALAEASGRKQSAVVPPKSGKKTSTDVLSDEERAAAAALGISEKDYLKYR